MVGDVVGQSAQVGPRARGDRLLLIGEQLAELLLVPLAPQLEGGKVGTEAALALQLEAKRAVESAQQSRQTSQT